MPQYLIIVFALVTFLKDSFKGINKKYLYGIGVGILLYFLYKRFQKSQAETLLNQAGDNLLVQLCTDLKDAMNPSGIELLSGFDGTDESKIEQVAAELKLNGKTYQQLAETWEKIYKNNLTEELTKEGVKDIFLKANTTTTTTTTGSSSTTNTAGVIKYGSVVVATGDNYNLRDPKDFTIKRKTKAGEEFTVTTVANNKTIAGTTGTWYAVQKSEWVVLPYVPIPYYTSVSFWVFSGGIKLKR